MGAKKSVANNTERIRQQSEKRGKLWREHVARYEKVLDESPDTFSEFSEEFRERFLEAGETEK
jgi:transposase